jgi:cytochrome c oxidase cbb3-type subunit 3
MPARPSHKDPIAPTGNLSGRGRRTLWLTVTVTVMVIAVVTLAVAQQLHKHQAMKSRLLMAAPDDIANDRELLDYARRRGKVAYGQHCAACHRSDMTGDPGRGIPNLVDADWLYGTGRVGEIERIVLYGIRAGHSKTKNLADMPAFATSSPYARYTIEPLSPREVDDVTALVYSFKHPEAVDKEAVARGAAIYHGKGLCFDCHADHAKGDPAIGAPNLTDDIWLYGDGSIKSIKEEISHGLAGVCPQWVSRLAPETIRAIAGYVHAARDGKVGTDD